MTERPHCPYQKGPAIKREWKQTPMGYSRFKLRYQRCAHLRRSMPFFFSCERTESIEGFLKALSVLPRGSGVGAGVPPQSRRRQLTQRRRRGRERKGWRRERPAGGRRSGCATACGTRAPGTRASCGCPSAATRAPTSSACPLTPGAGPSGGSEPHTKLMSRHQGLFRWLTYAFCQNSSVLHVFFIKVCFPNNNSKRPDSIIRDIHHISLKKSDKLKIKSNQKIKSTHFLCQLCQQLSCAVCPPPPAGCQ